MPEELVALLVHLNATSPQTGQIWRDWQITPITGGANNLLYRASGPNGDYAVKFTVRDERNRAGREYNTLAALQQAGLQLAPQAVWIDPDRYHHPVVVQTWLDGAVLTAPPQTDADWAALLRHFCAIHTLTPAQTTFAIDDAVLNAASGAAGKTLIHRHAARLPETAQSPSLRRLLAWLEIWTPPTWPDPPCTLCRVDANWRNFVRRPGDWASVDWENSGWGDPAFEIADLITHPAYEAVSAARWEQLIEDYADQRGDPGARLRIRTYEVILLVWWVVRCARYLYEVPRGLDTRLVTRPENWRAESEKQYRNYVARAEACIAAIR